MFGISCELPASRTTICHLPVGNFDDSWDCTQLKERLEELYLDGRIDWSPANLPTVSPGPQPTADDIPDYERRDVLDFLRRHEAL